MAKTALPNTQAVLPFVDVREGIVVMQDGSFRAVGMASAVNFALKSEKEQNAIVYQYQNFLNSLNFPIQIVMQSKRLDLTTYLKSLQGFEDRETNELLRIQIGDYRAFIARLITVANIMDKRFYVVASHHPVSVAGATGIQSRRKGPITIGETEFRAAKDELNQHMLTIQSGLAGIGLQVAPLNTQQLVELLYATYNPEEAEAQKLDEVENLQEGVVVREPGQAQEVATAQGVVQKQSAQPTPPQQANQDATMVPFGDGGEIKNKNQKSKMRAHRSKRQILKRRQHRNPHLKNHQHHPRRPHRLHQHPLPNQKIPTPRS